MSSLLTAKVFSLVLFGTLAVLWILYLMIKPSRKAMQDHKPLSPGPIITFSQEGRGGNFTYQSPEGRFTSWWEFGGGDTLAILSVPSEAQWEAKTGILPAKRQEVLDFIGQETVRQKSPNGRHEVDGDSILIYSS